MGMWFKKNVERGIMNLKISRKKSECICIIVNYSEPYHPDSVTLGRGYHANANQVVWTYLQSVTSWIDANFGFSVPSFLSIYFCTNEHHLSG